MEDFIKKHNIKKPNFFIIGAPKCGTTSMARYLGEHPDIFFSDPKEPNFFNTDFSDEYRKVTNIKDYLKLFRGADKYKAVGEGTVWYLFSKEATPNILKFNPEAKFILMTRNEVEMFRSLHFQLLSALGEKKEQPEKAWYLQKKRRQGQQIPSTCKESKILQYGKICKLGKQLEKILSILPNKDNLKIIKLEELKNNPRKIYKETLKFLGVEDDSREEFPVYNKAGVTKLKTIKKILASFAYDSKLKKISRKIKNKIGIKHWPFLAKINKWNKKEIKKPSISQEFKKELEDYFREDQKLLDKLIKEKRQNN